MLRLTKDQLELQARARSLAEGQIAPRAAEVGLAYKNIGRTEQALSDYQAAIEINPAHRKAYFDRANILYGRGLYRDAFRDYFKSLRILLSFS